MRGVKLVLVHHPDVRGRRGASSASLLYQRVMGAGGGQNRNVEAAALRTNLSSGACHHVSVETSGNWVPQATSTAVTSFSAVQLRCGGTVCGSNIFFNKKVTRTAEAALDGPCAALGETVYHYRAATLLSQESSWVRSRSITKVIHARFICIFPAGDMAVWEISACARVKLS